MYLIDHGPALLPTAPPPPTPNNLLPLRPLAPAPSPPSSGPSLSTTLGLSIHALADGIALGASSTTPSSLSLLIFLAIMIHKAPAAFGLTSVLLRQGVGKRGARARLVLFSLAAPVGAVGTGGTFLYVAMHTMQEDDEGGHGQGDAHGNAYVDGGMGRETRRKEGKSLGLVLAAVGGMLLPLIAQIGHAH
ncbi:MAG: hypothetical protein FRX48_05023 [Lasallia pustulata]|uniref:Zinc/iron permease n=1 Tax=Lasallia pustulata TaxID=136370 RepID=A0A5M8PRS4_9LECA|nr:MAG: hypothetical protein FRX48_05023 [Lasallia pustulata]